VIFSRLPKINTVARDGRAPQDRKWVARYEALREKAAKAGTLATNG
jgi:hypothetical protein